MIAQQNGLALEAKHVKTHVCRLAQANRKGDYFPIWGTCLGLEQLFLLTNGVSLLTRTNTTDVSLPLKFTKGKSKQCLSVVDIGIDIYLFIFLSTEAKGSRMFRGFPPELMDALALEPLTENSHRWSLAMEVQ